MGEDTQPTGTSHTDEPSVDGTTARLTLPAEDFAFAPVFERAPDALVEIASTAACLDDHAIVNITADECDRTVVESTLRTDPAVTDVRCIAERTDEWTYRMQWDGRARGLVERFVAEDATLLNARGRKNRWLLRVLTPDRNALSRMYGTITDLGYTVDLQSITAYEGGDATHSTLTDEQQEALTAAYEAGYYHIPQDITADELAERLDISHQALSERLHRAYEQLVQDELVINDSRRS